MVGDMGISLATSDIMKLGKRTAEEEDELHPVKRRTRLEHLNVAPGFDVDFDISKLFSPPRVAKVAEMVGMRARYPQDNAALSRDGPRV